jgi:leucyl/phenylalanyl-tRNA--protein transferase
MKPGSSVRSSLTTELVLRAYRVGYFPMADSRTGEISWYSPDPRAIIPLDGLHVSRSLRNRINKRTYDIRLDTAFEDVIRACAGRKETWISQEIIDVFVKLHHQGYAHSVESWNSGKLTGGLYGVSIGGAFFGESMFSLMTDASKVALVFLVVHLRNSGFTLLDVQFITRHLASLGAREISRSVYIEKLHRALSAGVSFHPSRYTKLEPRS